MPATAGFPNLGKGKSAEAKNEDYTGTHSIHSSRTLLFQASALPTMLDFLLNHGTVLLSKKTAIMPTVRVFCLKERSHSVSNSLQGRFPMSLLLGFLLHAHRTTYAQKMFRQCINLRAVQTQGFQHMITPAILPGLSQEYSLHEQLQG